MSDSILPVPKTVRNNLTGKVFGRLTVLGFAGRGNHRKLLWLCRCECGNTKAITADCLGRKGRGTKSCGCEGSALKIARGEYQTTHGMSKSGAYRSYKKAKSRCTSPRNNQYHNYGAAGVEFRFQSFEEFYECLGDRPEGHSIDRISSAGHYEPGNVRWATPAQQSNNTSNNIRIEYHGKTKTLAQWCIELGVSYKKIHDRLNRYKWSVKRAFETP